MESKIQLIGIYRNDTIKAMLSKIFSLLNKRERVFLILVLGMSVGLSLIEIIGITAIMPFISVASNPMLIDTNHYLRFIYNFLGISSKNQFVIILGVLLIGFYIFRGIYSYAYQFLLNKFSYGRFHVLSGRLFNIFIRLRYKDFVNRNSASMSNILFGEVVNVALVINQVMIFFSEIIIILLFYVILLYVNFKLTLLMSVILVSIVLILTKIVSRKLKKIGAIRADFVSEMFRIFNEALGNFKFIKLLANENDLLNTFSKSTHSFSRINILNSTVPMLPKIFLETIGFSVLIAVVIYILMSTGDATKVIPIITLYALALYRILPSANKIMVSYGQIIFYAKALDLVTAELDYKFEDEGSLPIDFSQGISLKNLSFAFSGENVIKDISINIKKGEKVAFVGKSGSGKSTLVDIIIGIYKPDGGEIYVDNIKLCNENIQSWRKKIGYIPQDIYLFDGTIGENVAFGHEYNESKIIECLIKANIYEFLQSKQGLQTPVGEGGVQLSGGQKQRVGIARALYSDPDILVLDEATSALDNDTEAKIMDEIYDMSSDKTLLVVAHRLSTVKRCDRVMQLENGMFI